MKTRALVPLLLACLLPATCTDEPDPATPSERKGVTVLLGHWSRGKPYELIHDSLARFTGQTGIPVTYVPAPMGKPTRLESYLTWLGRGDKTPDVYQADVTEIGRLAPHMIDLTPFLAAEAQEQIPSVMAHHYVEGRMVAFPLYTDVGLLLYRTDLLDAYGFGRPPETWDELEVMARRIQAGQRAAGRPHFWALAWPGESGDDLLCVALEVQAAHGGGRIVESDRTISVNNRGAARAMSRMKGWVGTISPPGVTAYGPVDARNLWISGDAAFLLSWPYAYAMSQEEGAPVRGKVGVAAVPSGGGPRVGTLGGWQLSVSRYSERPAEAAALVRFLIRREEQKRRAIVLGGLPPARHLYDDPEVRAAHPHFPMLERLILEGTVVRPATETGSSYTAVSEAYVGALHSVLKGEAEPAAALAALESELAAITGFRTAPAAQADVRP